MPSSLAELLSLLTDVIILNFVPKAPLLINCTLRFNFSPITIVPKLTKFVLTFNLKIWFNFSFMK